MSAPVHYEQTVRGQVASPAAITAKNTTAYSHRIGAAPDK